MVYHDKRLNVSSSSKDTLNVGLLELKTDLFHRHKCIHCLVALQTGPNKHNSANVL